LAADPRRLLQSARFRRRLRDAIQVSPVTVRITAYYRVSTCDGVRVALAKFGPCLLITPHYNRSACFWRPSMTNYVDWLTAKHRLRGERAAAFAFADHIRLLEAGIELVPPPTRFHCVVIVGCSEHGFLLRNSWGPRWGTRGGYAWFPTADFDKFAIEIWAIADVRWSTAATAPSSSSLLAMSATETTPRSSNHTKATTTTMAVLPEVAAAGPRDIATLAKPSPPRPSTGLPQSATASVT